MRCEICNRGQTELYQESDGTWHEYCYICIDEINDTLSSYEDDEDDWEFFDYDEDDDDFYDYENELDDLIYYEEALDDG